VLSCPVALGAGRRGEHCRHTSREKIDRETRAAAGQRRGAPGVDCGAEWTARPLTRCDANAPVAAPFWPVKVPFSNLTRGPCFQFVSRLLSCACNLRRHWIAPVRQVPAQQIAQAKN